MKHAAFQWKLCMIMTCCLATELAFAQYRPDGTLEQGGRVINNPGMAYHNQFQFHQDQQSSQNNQLMSIDAVEVSNISPGYNQKNLSTIENDIALPNNIGRLASILYLDVNPYTMEPNKSKYDVVLNEAAGKGYQSTIANDGVTYLTHEADNSDRMLVSGFLKQLPEHETFKFAKSFSDGKGGVAAMVTQSAEAVEHLANSTHKNDFNANFFNNNYVGSRPVIPGSDVACFLSPSASCIAMHAKHGYTAVGGTYLGDPRAEIYSYGADNLSLRRAEPGHDVIALEFTDTADWILKMGNFHILRDANGIPVTDAKLTNAHENLTQDLRSGYITYNALGPNSNSATTEAARRAGAINPDVPDWAPGEGTSIPKPLILAPGPFPQSTNTDQKIF